MKNNYIKLLLVLCFGFMSTMTHAGPALMECDISNPGCLLETLQHKSVPFCDSITHDYETGNYVIPTLFGLTLDTAAAEPNDIQVLINDVCEISHEQCRHP